MKKRIGTVAGVLLILAGAGGCVAVSSKANKYADATQAVAMNGKIYLVNTHTGRVSEIDPLIIEPFKPGADDEDMEVVSD